MKNYNEAIIERSHYDGDGVDDEKMNEGFNYGSICREDVLYIAGEEHRQKVENISDYDMSDLAERMYDGCIENYWYEVLDGALNDLNIKFNDEEE